MNSFLNLSTNAIKTADSLIRHAKEETYDEVEDSIKSLRKNFKAGNYFAIATFFIIFGVSSVLTQVFNGNYFIQAMVRTVKRAKTFIRSRNYQMESGQMHKNCLFR